MIDLQEEITIEATFNMGVTLSKQEPVQREKDRIEYLCLALDLWRLMRVHGRNLKCEHKCTASAKAHRVRQ